MCKVSSYDALQVKVSNRHIDSDLGRHVDICCEILKTNSELTKHCIDA